MTLSLRKTIALSVVALAACTTRASAAPTGTIVVRLVTDPSPAGVSWTYTGAGAAFQLGTGATERAVTGLGDGSYRITETPPAGAPATLTAVRCVDPSGGSRSAVATATASVSLSSGETVTCSFTHRALGPQPSASAVALARQYAPTLRLAAAEHYRPAAMQDYVARTIRRTGTPPRGRTAQLRPTLFSLPVSAGASYLDVRGAEPYRNAAQYRTIEQQLEGARPRPTVYWHLARQPSTGRIALEYWFLYLYNDFADRHEADWEGVTVFVDGDKPLGVAYSQHQGRTWVAWPAAQTDDHPASYVAAGSHANYALPGQYRVKVCWTLSVRRCTTTSRRDAARGDGATLRSSGYDLQVLGGTGFTGSWGSGSYLLGVGLTRDRIVDPRRRSDYSNPFAAIPPGS